MGRSHSPRRFSLAAFARTGFGAALAFFALALQSFVIETHVDAAAFRPAIEAGAAIHADQGDQKAPAICIICQAAALSRVALLADAPAIGALETLYLSAAPPHAPLIETRPMRPWQSRAPPSQA